MGPYGALIKYGGIAVAILAAFAFTFYKGMQYTQREWDAAIAQQAVAAQANMIAAEEDKARREAEFQIKMQQAAQKKTIVTKEVKVYVESPTQKCILSPEFERAVNALRLVYDPHPDGVPASAETPGEPALASDAPLTDVAILRFTEHVVIELYALWDRYSSLRDWVLSSHKIAREGAGR